MGGEASGHALWRRSLSAYAAMLASGEATAEAAVESCLERIAATNLRLNAIVHLDAEGARRAARESDARRRRGQALGPLDGIPLVVKDNIYVGGMPATWGSHGFADFVPAEDEICVARLRAAGMVVLGKTNTPEFAAQGYTGNLKFGVSRNPWNPLLTPGGSSGGSAAAVAAGMAPAALGTDGGGSTRRPAGHVGVVGFKPSTGLVPRWPGFPSISLDFEAVGIFARTVADVAILLAAMRGPDPRDRSSRLFAHADMGGGSAPRPTGRIYGFRGIGDRPVEPEVLAHLDEAAIELQAMGWTVDFGREPFDAGALDKIYAAVVGSGVASVALPLIEQGHEIGSPLAQMAQNATKLSAVDYARATHLVGELRAHLGELFTRYDFILSPAAAALPWPAEEIYPQSIGGRESSPRDHAPYTRFANVGGNPAVVVPTGISTAGLPMGTQLIGDFGCDMATLDIAGALQAAFPKTDRWAPS